MTVDQTTYTELRRQIRETKAEMRELGVKRFSCFNGGHSEQSYRLNSRMFQLETHLKDVKARMAGKSNLVVISGKFPEVSQ